MQIPARNVHLSSCFFHLSSIINAHIELRRKSEGQAEIQVHGMEAERGHQERKLSQRHRRGSTELRVPGWHAAPEDLGRNAGSENSQVSDA